MTRIGLAICLCLLAVVAAAQNTVLVRGGVVDESGAPVEGARVSLGALPVHVRTNAAGRFTIRLPTSAGALALHVAKAGFARAVVSRKGAQPELTVTLVRGAALTVHVIDQRGEPVAGANIRVSCPNIALAATSDDLGERRFGGLQPGRCGVNVGNVGAWMRIAGDPTLAQLGKAVEELLKKKPAADSAAKAEQISVELRQGEEATIVLLDASPPVPPTVTLLGEAMRFPPGTASVRGLILGPGRRPVEGARIVIHSPQGQMATFSNASGAYAFEGLPAGRFRVRASRPGLATREFGQGAASAPGRDVALLPGERVGGIDVTLTRGSAITGRVTGASGEPLEGVGVQLFRFEVRNGRTGTVASVGVPLGTDDRGMFRLSMVSPGAYYIAALGFGARRGEGPVFYPGAVLIGDAQPVQVDAGQDIVGVDIPFAPTIGARVRGTVVDAAGQPLDDGMVQLTGNDPTGGPVIPRTSELDAGGFEFLNVPPGRFVLTARSPQTALVLVAVKDGQVNRNQVPATRFGRVPLTVSSGSPAPIVIPTTEGSTLAGRIVLEGSAAAPAPSSFRLTAQGGQTAAIANDWTFQVSALSEPTRFLLAGPPGWWLKSLMVGDVDAADRQVPFGDPAASREDAIAVFASTAGQVSGSVADERGRSLNYSVIAFPTDPQKWYRGSRWVQVGRPNQTGVFAVTVPPGQYFVAAVDQLGIDQGPETLSAIAPLATVVTVGDNQRLQQDLRLSRLPRQ